jgi:anti-sigma B factor antagonist
MAVEGNLLTEVSREGGLAVLRLDGELDLASAPLLESEVQAAMADDPAAIALDLRGLEFIDSTGLRAILSLDERCAGRGLMFALVRGSEQVERLLSMTRVAEHLQIVDSPEELRLQL